MVQRVIPGREVLSSKKETKSSRILNPIPSGSWGTAICGRSFLIGLSKNLWKKLFDRPIKKPFTPKAVSDRPLKKTLTA